jgi:hypothetical protein
MNEYLALELMRQRTAERYEEARRASLVRALRMARRQRKRDDALVSRPVPDYVDGTFAAAEDQVQPKRAAAAR